MALLLPATGYAQVKRLELFANYQGYIMQYSSDDGGSYWYGGGIVPGYVDFANNKWFVGRPAVVSDQPGSLYVVAKSNTGELMINRYTSATRTWRGWSVVPGTLAAGASWDNGQGKVFIKDGFWTYWGYSWLPDSYPTLSSWGPGRLDVFMHATRAKDNATALVHSWAVNGEFAEWEDLGTGLMQESPAAVSFMVGRIDVFARANDTLVGKSFVNGSWSGWAYLGGHITSSPTVATGGYVNVNVFARGGDGHLGYYYFNGWSHVWQNLGGFLPPGTSPAAASVSWDRLNVLATRLDGSNYQKLGTPATSSWSDFTLQPQLGPLVATTAWVP